MPAPRLANLPAALGFLQLTPRAPELRLLHRWLDTWAGVGLITVGVERHGLRFSLSHIAESEWRAVFMRHNLLLAPEGFGVASTPWRAVQIAARAALRGRAKSPTTGGKAMDPSTFILMILAGGIGAFLGSYLKTKGQNLATHEDLDRVVRATEQLKTQVAQEASIVQKRWDLKLQCYRDISEHLAHAGAMLAEAVATANRPNDAEMSRTLEAMNRSATAARIAVPPHVRTLLSSIADKWQAATNLGDQRDVVHDGWIKVLDAARVDLFGEPSELASRGPAC